MKARVLAILLFAMAIVPTGCDGSADKDKNKDKDMPKPAKTG